MNPLLESGKGLVLGLYPSNEKFRDVSVGKPDGN